MDQDNSSIKSSNGSSVGVGKRVRKEDTTRNDTTRSVVQDSAKPRESLRLLLTETEEKELDNKLGLNQESSDAVPHTPQTDESVSLDDDDHVLDNNNNNDKNHEQQPATTPTPTGATTGAAAAADGTSRWTRWTHALHRFVVRRLLLPPARFAATYPRWTLVVLTVLSLVLLIVGLLTNFVVENETHALWPPTTSQSVEDSDWLYGESHFNYPPVTIQVMIHAGGANVLGQEGVQRVFDVLNTVTSIEGYRQGCDYAELIGDLYGIGQCSITSVADFWNESQTIFDATVRDDVDAIRILSHQWYPTGILVDVPKIMGKAKYADFAMVWSNDNTTLESESFESDFAFDAWSSWSSSLETAAVDRALLETAESYLIKFGIPRSNVTWKFEAEAISRLLVLKEQWQQIYHNKNSSKDNGDNDVVPFRLEFYSESSYEEEFMRAILEDLWLIPVSFAIVAIFTIIFAFGKCDRVKSRGLLGIGAVATILGSTMSAFGLLFIGGVPFTSNTLMLPFLMFGIGLDDTFIIFGSYHRKESEKDVPKRIESTMEDIGVAIFLTSLTSMLAFILGSFSQIPSVQWLCLYAFPCIGIDFFYQITFFVAMIVLDEQRIQDNRMDYLFCKKVKRNSDLKYVSAEEIEGNATFESENEPSEPFKGSPLCTDPKLDEPVSYNEVRNDVAREESISSKSKTTKRQHEDEVDSNQEQHLADRFMGLVARQILRPWFQCFSLFLFAGLSAVSIYFVTELEQQFNYTDLVPQDSYVKGFYDSLQLYMDNPGLPVDVFFRDVDQSDPDIQNQMQAYLDDLIKNGGAVEPVYFWLWDFKEYSASRETDGLFKNMTFEEQIDEFLDQPIYHELYDDEIGRGQGSSDRGFVYETRCPVQVEVIRTSSKATVDMLANLRRISGAQPINQGVEEWRFVTYSDEYHLYEFYKKVVEELIFTSVMGIVAVNAIALLFVPHWTAVFFTLPFITLLYCNMLGWLYITGVNINALSYITLVMSIGLMVDYILHILMRYYECKGTRRERIHETMSTMGSSIFLGAASTFLGLMPLALSTSNVFQDIFVSVVGLICFGVLNGLIFLPVVLSLVGPE